MEKTSKPMHMQLTHSVAVDMWLQLLFCTAKGMTNTAPPNHKSALLPTFQSEGHTRKTYAILSLLPPIVKVMVVFMKCLTNQLSLPLSPRSCAYSYPFARVLSLNHKLILLRLPCPPHTYTNAHCATLARISEA